MSIQTIRGDAGDALAPDSPTYSTATPKPTGPQVVDFRFNSATYMVSQHPEHGSALSLRVQGRVQPIAVGTVLVRDSKIDSVEWETPYSGYPPEWHGVMRELVRSHATALIAEVSS